MAEAGGSSSEEEKIKRRLLWEKVNDPNFAKEPTDNKKKIYQRNSLARSGVPMIHEDLLQGSSNNVSEHKITQKLLTNPLVPLGMLATVGCLIGRFILLPWN
jgi:hypothetical protein